MAAESSLLTSNRQELVTNIRLVEPFLDKLLQENQLTGEECDVVRSERTPQDRARALIDVVATKGQEAFCHFRQCLKQTNPELEDELHRCVDHNERLKLHCDDCVQLLCRKCSVEGHQGHRLLSIVAEACVIRREVTTFFRDNRKLLKTSNASGNEEARQNLLLDIELRKNTLKAMFNAKIESEYEWCKDQLRLGACQRDVSPAASISSIATTGSEMSGKHTTEPAWLPKVKTRKVVRKHPYLREGQNSKGVSPAPSPAIPKSHSTSALSGPPSSTIPKSQTTASPRPPKRPPKSYRTSTPSSSSLTITKSQTTASPPKECCVS